MKVLNVTMHAVDNYGSVLQTYATERIFENLGCEVETLDYIQKGVQLDSIARVIKNGGPGWIIKCKQLFLYLLSENISERKVILDQFRKKYLHLSNRRYLADAELTEERPNADIYCTGSDQTWNTSIHGVNSAYFLDFVPEGKRKIAFSASFGMEELPAADVDKVKGLLSSYYAISVREKSGLSILKNLGIANAKWVLDPTLAVNPKIWYDMATERLINEDYIFVYQLNTNATFSAFVNKFAVSKGLKVVYVKSRKNYQLKNSEYFGNPSPEELLSLFKHSSFVITDSFHATVFSLVFHRDFLDIFPQRFSTRLNSLLELTGLENRQVTDFSSVDYGKDPIDYNKVDALVENKRDETIAFLKYAIS